MASSATPFRGGQPQNKVSPSSGPESQRPQPSMSVSRGKVPLEVDTKADSQAYRSRGSQSPPGSQTAQPPSLGNRKTSNPTTVSAEEVFPSQTRAQTSPKSAAAHTLRFGPIGGFGERKDAKKESRRKSGSDLPTTAKRNDIGSNEGRTNVYTECGRHSNQWLFGGWGKILGERTEPKDDN